MFLNTLLLFLILSSCSVHSTDQTLNTVDHVDVQKYLGRWYAISALPQFFTKDCLGQVADYTFITSSKIGVKNTCFKEASKKAKIKGVAEVINQETNAELEVAFDKFFLRLFNIKGDYNILALTPDYQNVMVGSRDRESLWIMSRSTKMDSKIYQEFVLNAQKQGFPTSDLKLQVYE